MALQLPNYPINLIAYGAPASTAVLNAPLIEIDEDLLYLKDQVEPLATNLSVDGTGNVGIGTTNPTAKLDINGGLKVEGALSSNGIDDQATTNQITITDSKISAELLVPTGTILAYSIATVPDGWLECNGAGFNESTHQELANVLWDGTKYIYGGNTHENGSGSAHFFVPDLRGKFMRGWNNGSGNDPDAGTRSAQAGGGATGDNVGSVQNDTFQGHWHNVYGPNGHTASYDGGGSTLGHDFATVTGNMLPSRGTDPITGSHGTPRVSSETRPKNVNVMYIIKY